MELKKEPSKDQTFLDLLRETVINNLDNEQFGVENLSEQVGISRSQLHRKLKKLKSSSVSQFIREVRLEEALKLLRDDVATTSEIAYRVGFNSPSYFHKCFKEQYGFAPGEIKKHGDELFPLPEQEAVLSSDRKRRSWLFLVVPMILFVTVAAYFLFSDSGKIRSLAVLPLHNYTGDTEQDYFVNGFQDALIGALGQLSDLRVISRTSTLRYREGSLSLQEIARELGVDAIIEGSVNGKGNQIRIQLQLVKAFPKETHIWTNEYEQNLATLPILKSRIVRSIASEVNLTLTPAEELLLSRKKEVNPEAQKLYMRGLFHWDRLSRTDLDLALQYFERSIEIDPEFAAGYAGIASVWVGRLQQGLVYFSEGVANGRVAAQRALALDSTMSSVYGTLGAISGWVDWNYVAAEDYFKRSIILNPNNSRSHAYLAHILLIRKRPDEAMRHMKVALDLDPFNQLCRGLYAMSLNFTQKYDRAVKELEDMLNVDPNDRIALSTLRTTYHMREDYEKAYQIWLQSYEARNDPQAIRYLQQGYKSEGYSGALSELAALLIARSDTLYVTPWQIGTLYTRAGKKAQALTYLKKAYEAHDSNMPYIGVDPIFTIFKDDPEYRDLLARMNLRP